MCFCYCYCKSVNVKVTPNQDGALCSQVTSASSSNVSSDEKFEGYCNIDIDISFSLFLF